MNPRIKICARCKHYSAYTANDGFCDDQARRGVKANREATSVCEYFDPVTDNLPPVPEGTITWHEYDAATPEGLPIYGGEIIVRYVIVNHNGETVGSASQVLVTPFEGKLEMFKKFYPYDAFDSYIPTHFAYINQPT